MSINTWTPDDGLTDGCEQDDELVAKTDDPVFHVHDGAALTAKMACAKCGGDRFLVGVSYCFTVIKCPTCGWENCVHSG